MVEGDGAGTKKDKSEGEGGEGQGKLVAVFAQHSIVDVNFGDGDGQIYADGERGSAGKQADEDEDAAEKFGKGGKVGAPAGKSQAGDELNMVVKSTENLMVAVNGHHSAQCEAHNEESQRLQAIKVTQVISPRKKKR